MKELKNIIKYEIDKAKELNEDLRKYEKEEAKHKEAMRKIIKMVESYEEEFHNLIHTELSKLHQSKRTMRELKSEMVDTLDIYEKIKKDLEK